MASINVSLSDQLLDFAQKRIDEGRYENVSAYICHLIRCDQCQTESDERWLQELDASIERSLEDVRVGRLTDASKVFDRLEAKYRRMAAEKDGA